MRTSVSARIEDAVAFAQTTNLTVVIRGPAGMGKSSALADIARRRSDRAVALEIVQSGRTVKGLLSSVVAAMGISTYRVNVSDLHDILHSRLYDMACSDRFLMIDEVQNADLNGIRCLLGLQEHTHVPLVLCGNAAALKRTASAAAAFDQIEDRVGKWVELVRPAADDIRDIAMAWGVEGVESFDAIVTYGQKMTIRKTVRLLRICREITGGAPIRFDHIVIGIQYLTDHPSASKLLETA